MNVIESFWIDRSSTGLYGEVDIYVKCDGKWEFMKRDKLENGIYHDLNNGTLTSYAFFPPPWNMYEHPEKTEGWIEFQKAIRKDPKYYLEGLCSTSSFSE